MRYVGTLVSLLILKVRCLSSEWGKERLLDSKGGFLVVLISQKCHIKEMIRPGVLMEE